MFAYASGHNRNVIQTDSLKDPTFKELNILKRKSYSIKNVATVIIKYFSLMIMILAEFYTWKNKASFIVTLK